MGTTVIAILTSILASFLAAEALVFAAARHGRFMDLPGAIQKFHSRPTPRMGGAGIYLALCLACAMTHDESVSRILATLLLAGLPALIAGLAEDFTQRVRVATRLAATMVSGLLACWTTGIAVTRLDIPPVDAVLAWTPLAVAFTVFAVAGIANALNIIDGFHGLASGTANLCLLAFAAIAALAGDTPLAIAAVVIAAAIAGFWFVNFPWGRLFLGDGGAYFTGFALAWIAVLVPARNPGISPWASLLVCAYPVVEVVYSIVRRHRARRPAGEADRDHLHSLVATRVVQRRFSRLHPTLQNSSVSVIMWACAAVPAGAAIVFRNQTPVLVVCTAAYVMAYHFAYRRVAAP